MPVCCAFGCNNRTGVKKTNEQKKLEETQKITFHLFPKKPDRRDQWIKAIRRVEWAPSSTSVVCSIHFTDDSFDRTSLSSVRLRETAVPSVFKTFPSYLQKEKKAPIASTSNVPTLPVAGITSVASTSAGDVPSTASLREDTSNFIFPNDPQRRLLWLERIQRSGSVLPKTARLCSRHFSEIDYIRGTGKLRFLKKGALPLSHEDQINLNNCASESILEPTKTRNEPEVNVFIPQPSTSCEDQKSSESSISSSESDSDSYLSTSTTSSQNSEIDNCEQNINFVNNASMKMSNKSDNISIKDFGKLCRTCLCEGEMQSLYEKCYKDNCLLEMLMSVTFVKVSEKDGLPSQICLNCKSELTKAYNFAQKCIEVDKKLQSIKNYKPGARKKLLTHTKTLKSADEMQTTYIKETELKNEFEIEEKDLENVILINNEHLTKNEHNYCVGEKIIEENLPLTSKDNFIQTKVSTTNLNDEINQNGDLKPKKNQIRRKSATLKKKLKEINYDSHKNQNDFNIDSSETEPKKKQVKRKNVTVKLQQLQENEGYDENCDKNSDPKPKKKLVRNKTQLPRKKRFQGPPYECKKCFENFETYKLLWLHWKQAKHPPKYGPISCKVCLRQVPYKAMKQHMRIHTLEKPYICEMCGIKFSIKGNLDRHMKIHTGEKPHKCTMCEKAFIQLRSLKDHIRVHTGEKPYVCNICGRKFTSDGFYKLHFNSRHANRIRKTPDLSTEPQHECETCQKKFNSKAVLKTHQLIHGEKKFLCNHCGIGFFTKGRLDIHLKVHTGEKPYSCEICNKSFSQSGSLKSHILTHTGEKPFICKICNRGFAQGQHLSYHMRTHSNEKPYSCEFCGKKFSHNCNLRIHTRIHTGETPYLCPVCNKGFYDSSSMHKHKRKHEKATA